MTNFNANWDERIDKELARDIIKNGKFLGDGECEKDCYWRGYEKDGKFYLGLNDGYNLWEVNEDIIKDYVL
jgi:hypothetical protein